ncbi:MAG TPA: ABC transporter substrate-binding protein [Alphaproteobacteria bacterium]|nr:ABC transporter substrate-binding protein [Alphaproteobacteria bacterium]
MKRRDVLLACTALVLAGPAAAQTTGKVRRIGTLGNLPPSDSAARPPWEQFLAALREQGWVEGDNLVVLARWADGRPDRYPQLADELIALQAEVIVAFGGSYPTQILKQRTTSIPIVMLNTSYPVESGFVASLARPGGNITGITNQLQDLSLKNIELMRELVPGLQRFGLIWEPDNLGSRLAAAEFQEGAPGVGVTLISAPLRSADGLDAAFDILVGGRAQAVLIHPTPIASRQRARIIQFAIARRLPTLTPADVHMRAGYLVSYGPDWIEMHRRAAHYVDRILRGAEPAELPVEQPTRFTLGFNLRTAQAIGLEIPPTLLLRADEVVE